MRSTIPGLFAATLLLGAPALAMAQNAPAYPISITQGENTEYDFGPGNPRGTLVGGGAVEARQNGENSEIRHLDPRFVQQEPDGLVALSVGSGENSSVIFVPRSPRG
jgi:hypothetical protein